MTRQHHGVRSESTARFRAIYCRMIIVAVLGLIGVALGPTGAWAQFGEPIVWRGSGGSASGAFENATNWDPQEVPGFGDPVRFDLDETYTVTVASDPTTAPFDVLGGDLTLTGSDRTWTVDWGPSVSGAELTLSDFNVRSDPGGVVIGSTADGTLTTTNGASIFSHAQGFVVGGNRNVTGTATVTGPGSNWETRHQIEVGHYGTGNLEINGGATVECDLSFVGYKSGSVGNVTVTGENSYFDAGLSASFGHEGEGRLTVLDGAHVRAGLASIGEKAGSHGIVRVSGRDTLLEVGEGLMVGGNNLGPGGQGELIVDDAGVAKLYGLIWDALRVYPAGTITLRGGEISASSTVVFEPGSVLRGAGLLELFGLESSIAGTIRPGIETVGVIEVELEHSPLDFADTTELQIQLDSPASGHDALHVNGTLNVDGVLTVELLDGFHPAPYSQFDIVTAVPNRHGIGGLVGQFDDLQLPPLRPGFDWQWEYTDTALTLTAVPEPSALALTAIALALAAIARRRR